MHWRIATISLFVLGVGGAMTTRAEGVTTYGAGLESCGEYLEARDGQSSEEMVFVEWFSGYLSGVNSTYNRANNILADSNLKQAMYWVEKYCRAHPTASFGTAAFALLRAASSTTRTQDTKPITYGAGLKSCATYLHAREQRDPEEMDFVDWLGGYLSGVNAISLGTTNILGTSDIAGSIPWLDSYCGENVSAHFAAAVDARLAAAVAVNAVPSRR